MPLHYLAGPPLHANDSEYKIIHQMYAVGAIFELSNLNSYFRRSKLKNYLFLFYEVLIVDTE